MDLSLDDDEPIYNEFFEQLNLDNLNNFQIVDQNLIFSSDQQSNELINEFCLQQPTTNNILNDSNVTTHDESFVSASETCSPLSSVFSPFTDDELLLSPDSFQTKSWVCV